jgi:hypothetical protein
MPNDLNINWLGFVTVTMRQYLARSRKGKLGNYSALFSGTVTEDDASYVGEPSSAGSDFASIFAEMR